MDIYIDSRKVDTGSSTSAAVTLSIASLTDLSEARTGYSKSVILPMTNLNRELLGYPEEVNGMELFNLEQHTARVEESGCVILEGLARLTGCVKSVDGTGYYRLNIIGAGIKWVRAAEKIRFDKLPLGFTGELSAATIGESWSRKGPVVFLPVIRDNIFSLNEEEVLVSRLRNLTHEDYHPFISVREIFKSIFRICGYELISEFIDSAFFSTLYVSGNFRSRDTSSWREKMDFTAGRFADVSAVADSHGRVYADPLRVLNSLGNIVDTANPWGRDDAGNAPENVFDAGGCFGTDGERIVFRPLTEIKAGFEYRLKYTTEYIIENRDRLKGFDRVILDDEHERLFKIKNGHLDHRDNVRPLKSYLFIIFEHTAGDTYMITYDEVTANGSGTSRSVPAFGTRTRTVLFGSTGNIENVELWIKTSGSDTYYLCRKDWALYDGYVQEKGELDLDVVVSSVSGSIKPSDPKYFTRVVFAGAGPGMKLSLKKATTLRPLFRDSPGQGDILDFAAVANHSFNCLKFVNAIRHMFNLCFYTDELSRTVLVEPAAAFYSSGTVVDWTAKVDRQRAVTISELSGELSSVITVSYVPGDAAVTQWETRNSDRLGTWTRELTAAGAADGERNYINPLFSPSISSSGNLEDAKIAHLLHAGTGTDDLNFPVKIVCYPGTLPLGGTQSWGWPTYGKEYPFAAFHHKGEANEPGMGYEPGPDDELSLTMFMEGFSLCFEDRDGHEGLHSFYDGMIETCLCSRRVEAWVWLTSDDIEPFVIPDQSGCDFRASYRLGIDGENTLYRLESICDYDPSSNGPTKCVFVKII